MAMSDTIPSRFNMRVEGRFKERLQRLMDKKGIDGTSVVKLAIAEMAEREFGQDMPDTPVRTMPRKANSPSVKK